MANLRTPLAKVRGLGSAKEGIHHWWLQRVTAVANIPLTLATVWIVLVSLRTDYAGVVSIVGHPCVGAILILFVLNAFYHAALGLQVVIEDYVHGGFQKTVLLLLVKFLCAILAVIGVVSVIIAIVMRAAGS